MTDTKQKTILLVENKIDYAGSLSLQLEKEGYKVFHAINGDEAINIALAKENSIDLTLIDFEQGTDRDAVEITEEIVKERELPVICLISKLDKEFIQKTEKIITYGYYLKNSDILFLYFSIKNAFKLIENNEKLKEKLSNRKSSEKALNEGANFYQDIIERFIDGVWISDRQDNIIYANKSMDSVYGITNEYLNDINILSSLHESIFHYLKPFYLDAKINLKPIFFNAIPVMNPNGIKIFQTGWFIPKINDGEYNGMICSTRDVTESNQAEEASGKNEKQLRMITENVPVFIAYVGLDDLRYRFVNSKFESFYGIPRNAIIGMQVRDIIGEKNYKFALEYINKIRNGIETTYENVFNTAQGKFWLRVNYVPTTDEYGKVEGFIVLGLDITGRRLAEEALKESEEKYRNLVERANDGICIIQNGILRFVNPALSKILGYEYDELIDHDYKQFIPPGELPRVRDRYERRIAGENVPSIYESVIIGKNKKLIDIEYNVGVVNYQGIKSDLTVIRDITERKQKDEKILNLLHEKEFILKEVHHRIKNNLNTIFGLLILQAEESENSEIRNILNDAAGRVKSMLVLYDKLYRSENSSSISIEDYFQDLIKDIVSLFPQMETIKIKTQIENIILNAKILSPIGIILNELITNTMKYAFVNSNEKIITVMVLKQNEFIKLIYEDNGSGIPDSISLENSSGFGLHLIGMLAKQLKASVAIERKHGTRFVIEIKNFQ